MAGNFDTHKWFKKQYLEEAGINEDQDWDSDVDEDVRSRVSQALTRIEDYKKNTRNEDDYIMYDFVEIALLGVIDALDNVLVDDDDEPWTDPAGGTHYGDEDDPAAAYIEETKT